MDASAPEIDVAALARSGHVDGFARGNLPPREQWPALRFDLPELAYPERLNCATEFLDRAIHAGRGDHPAVVTPSETLSYRALADRADRLARVLVAAGFVPGNRVLLRGANNAWMAAAHFAAWKAGGVVVATMPLLRAKELAFILRKAEIGFALCDGRLRGELDRAVAEAPLPCRALFWGDGQLEAACAAAAPGPFEPCDTAADDVCLIAFTSGTTGEPKGTMHFHRDMLATCDTYGRHVLRLAPEDRVTGSPPFAFTFGLVCLLLFPFRVGATTVLLEKASPPDLVAAAAAHRATALFTAPTSYRAMAALAANHDLSSLRKCVSAGEALPVATIEAWRAATGLTLMDGIGGTEMLHIFIAAPEGEIRPGATGRAVPGYRARVVDEGGAELPAGTPGLLAVQGPTGCRYLADPRQARFVRNGWNFPGDIFVQDTDGYFWYRCRADDMIVSSGYNIAGPEVEDALLSHPAVRESAVVGVAEAERGQIVKAFVVVQDGFAPDAALAASLQEHVKSTIAPYKYPRAVAFLPALPRTGTGKLQRSALRAGAGEGA